jgi:hypothetical protein
MNLINTNSTNSINTIISIFTIFLLCICIITYYYNTKNELFIDPTSLPTPTPTPTQTQTSSKISTDELPNTLVNQTANEHITTLNGIFGKYNTINLDPGIMINNDGTICDQWSVYNNNKYSQFGNTCQIVPESGSTDYQCLVDNKLTSCNNYYQDGNIANYTNINTEKIKNEFIAEIKNNGSNLINIITSKSSIINKNIDSLKQQLDLQNQQAYFVKYNTKNLDDKQYIINKSTKDFEKHENDVNINKINFSNFLEQNNINEKKQNLYYKIILGLIITLIVLGGLNFMFS